MSITVARFETYPLDAPIGYAVGFVETFNGRTKYADTSVPFAETAGLDDAAIAGLAWTILETEFATWRASVATIPPIIGSGFSPTAPPPLPPPSDTLEGIKAATLTTIATTRFAKETAGIPIDGLGTLPTDRGSQAMLTSTLEFLKLMPDATIPWKLGNGLFVNLTLQHLQELGKVVGAHVLACFVNEARLADLVLAASTVEDVRAIGFDEGWPAAPVTIPGLVLPTPPPTDPPATDPVPTDPPATDPVPTDPVPTDPPATDPIP